MIIAALNQHRSTEGVVPFGYARKRNLGFELVLTPDGSGCRLAELYVKDDQDRPRAPENVVPNITRSNNPPPMLGCDTAGFVLGRPKPVEEDLTEKEAAAAARKHAAFVELLREYGAESQDPDVAVYLRWLDLGMPDLDSEISTLTAFGQKRLDLDWIAIRVEGTRTCLHMKSDAQAFWSRKAAAVKGAGGRQEICLSCGRFGPVVDTLPQPLDGNRIPGTKTSQVALLSANFPAASRGASGTGLKSAPICGPCASQAVNAFNELTASSKNHWRMGDETAAIWWASSDQLDDAVISLDEPLPERVKDLLDSVLSGKRASTDIPGKFFLITFSGNVARLVIRRFVELPLDVVAKHIGDWFRDVRTPDPNRPYRSLTALARSAGPLVAGGQSGLSPEGAFEALLMTALAHDPPPRALLHPAVARAKAEVGRLDEEGLEGWRFRQRATDRLALFRVILNRTILTREHQMEPVLDENRESKAYLCGRLFAVRERLQLLALRDRNRPDGRVNSSITDRYFARASSFPASVEHTLGTLERQHLSALQRKDQTGAYFALDTRITHLHTAIDVAPGRLSIEEQAEWIAGYYQQREADIQAATAFKKAHDTAHQNDSEEN